MQTHSNALSRFAVLSFSAQVFGTFRTGNALSPRRIYRAAGNPADCRTAGRSAAGAPSLTMPSVAGG
jgi:hypothetical protein